MNYKNKEKIICFSLFLTLFLTILFLGKKSSDDEKYYTGKIDEWTQAKTDNFKEFKLEEDYTSELISQLDFSAFRKNRNIFTRFQSVPVFEAVPKDKPVLKLLEISYKPLGIEYLGRVVFGDGSIVAQVNLHKDTYIVKEGARMSDYTVTKVEKEYLNLSTTSKLIRLNYRQKQYSNELVAKIVEINSKEVSLLSKGSQFFGFKVLDIDKDYVLLSNQGQQLKLEKGRLQ